MSTTGDSRLFSGIKRHPLRSFFILAYLGSWIFSIPFILSEWGVLDGDYKAFFVIKAFAGPFLAAYLITRVIDGKEGFTLLRKRITQRRFNLKYYLFVLLLIPGAIIIAILLQPNAFTGFVGFTIFDVIKYLILFIVVFFGGGPLAEEPGWRGFALPRMQNKYGPLLGSLFLGLLWAFWHAPDFLTSAQGGGPESRFTDVLLNFIIFTVLILSLSVIFTWISNKTNGSLLSVLLAHASVNTPQVAILPLFPSITTTQLDLMAMISFSIISIVIISSTKGELGYKK